MLDISQVVEINTGSAYILESPEAKGVEKVRNLLLFLFPRALFDFL